MDKKVLGGGVLLLALVILVLGVIFPRPVEITVDMIQEAIQKFGAIPGNEVSGNYFTVGGVERYFESQKNATSSVLCSFKNPFPNATTTIERVTVKTTSTFGAANTYDIATSTTAYGTSTPSLVYGKSIAANEFEQASWFPKFVASTTASLNTEYTNILFDEATNGGQTNFFLTGTQYLNVKVASSTPGTDTVNATCNFEGRKL